MTLLYYPNGLDDQDVEELPVCEKCGGELTDRMVNDEIYQKCADCDWIVL